MDSHPETETEQAPVGQGTSKQGGSTASDRAYAQGEALWNEGTGASRRLAIEKFTEALSLLHAHADHRLDGAILNSIGSIYSELGENGKSLEFFEQALAAAEKGSDLKVKAEALSNIAAIYDIIGDKGKAIGAYQQALSIVRFRNDRWAKGGVLNDMGLVYWSLGDLPKALDYFTQALPIRRGVADRRGEATTLHNLGVVHSSMAEFRKAVDYYGQALSLECELDERREQARTLNNLGVAYAGLGDYQKSLGAYEQALPIRRLTGDARGEAYTLANIGDLRAALGDYEEALKYYDQALPLDRSTGDRQGEALTLTGIGGSYCWLGQYDRALECYQHALVLWRSIGVRRGEAQILNRLGLACRYLGNYDKALEYLTRALELRRAVGDRGGEAETLTDMASLHLSMRKLQQALDCYSKALAIERAIGYRVGEVATLAGMARAQAFTGDFSHALAAMARSLDLFESVRSGVASVELRASLLASSNGYYEEYIDLLMRQHTLAPAAGYDALALETSERVRARGLIESLAEAGVDIREGIGAGLLSRERDIKRQLSEMEGRRSRLLAAGQDKSQIALLDEELEAALEQLQEVRANIRSASPGYAAMIQPATLSAAEIQSQMLDGDTLLLEYSLGQERSFLWAVTPNSITTFQLPKRAEIDAAARRAYELITQSNQRVHKVDAELAMRELGEMILGPAASLLGTKRLLIVPDGALHYIPFEALPEPCLDEHTGPSLIAGHEVVYLPSVAVLAELRVAAAGRQPQERAIAVLADPVFGSDDPRVKQARHSRQQGREAAPIVSRSIGETGGSLERLPYARQEAEAILHLASNGFGALDFDANRAAATSPDLGRYRVVHFATHALINSKHPELSGVVLSLVDRQGLPQDGFLAASDVYNLKLGADLVVLSACRTALGKEIRGEGLLSIVRGFMCAGSPRVIASLWDVRDEAAAEFMRRFYEGFLSDGLRPAAALRAAKVSLRREKRWESPYYWAGFVLQGEWK
jgi:CHAT domain-containing protein/tetratricopeptide (TPR) repeat protein